MKKVNRNPRIENIYLDFEGEAVKIYSERYKINQKDLLYLVRGSKHRDSDRLYRAIYDLTNESIHKIDNE